MIHDIQGQGEATAAKRVLAVVAGRKESANEVAACFARQGDRVEALWFPDTSHLLEAEDKPRFEAVILFAAADEPSGDAAEAAVRGVMRGIPIYRL